MLKTDLFTLNKFLKIAVGAYYNYLTQIILIVQAGPLVI